MLLHIVYRTIVMTAFNDVTHCCAADCTHLIGFRVRVDVFVGVDELEGGDDDGRLVSLVMDDVGDDLGEVFGEVRRRRKIRVQQQHVLGFGRAGGGMEGWGRERLS